MIAVAIPPQAVPAVPTSVPIPALGPQYLVSARDERDIALACAIDSREMYGLAAEQLRRIAGMRKTWSDERMKITRPLDAAKQAIMDFFRGPDGMLSEAEGLLRRELQRYDNEQQMQRLADERRQREAAEAERRRVDEEARIAREAAEAEAAREREEIAALADTDAAAARAAGRAEEAAQIVAQAAERVTDIDRRVEAQTQAIDDQAAIAVETAVFMAPVAEVPTAAGISKRLVWCYEVADMKALVAAAAAGDSMAFSCLTPNEKVLGAHTRALKAQFILPGVRVWSESALAVKAVRS